MKVLVIKENSGASEIERFFNGISGELAQAICKKLYAYAEADDIYMSNSLKILKPKIWGYKGTIYKLRVDHGKESARVMFTKNSDNDIVLLHGFVKKTQKTPSKDAKIAMGNLDRVKSGVEVKPLSLAG